ncbi:hypothetical protein SETIT_1G047900v2 [Setaria italica]|uniref:Uncharacterized protein n=1 Tax=Setaria italica TaxID=4555 RepID=A0A368PHG0_SETIT|nr:hypothetical protein SETIT_1G047900v2 [Setaria italica]
MGGWVNGSASPAAVKWSSPSLFCPSLPLHTPYTAPSNLLSSASTAALPRSHPPPPTTTMVTFTDEGITFDSILELVLFFLPFFLAGLWTGWRIRGQVPPRRRCPRSASHGRRRRRHLRRRRPPGQVADVRPSPSARRRLSLSVLLFLWS